MRKISILVTFATLLIFTACKEQKSENTSSNGDQDVKTAENTTAGEGAVNTNATKYFIGIGTEKLNWVATKLGGQHNGTIDLVKGFVDIEEEKIVGGTFIIDMATITVLDQEGEWKTKLEDHLRGYTEGKRDHFFNVVDFPTARIDIKKATALEGSEDANLMVYGDLMIKGVTKPIGFKANFIVDNDIVKLSAKEIKFDRTDFGVNYNSKKIFPDLQNMVINDEIVVSLEIKATKNISVQ